MPSPDPPVARRLRTFVAIELPEPIQQALGGTIDRFRAGTTTRAIRWVRPEAIHLTLRFLGEIDGQAANPIGESLDALCSRFDPILFEVAGLGGFPSLARPRVIWVGVRSSDDRLLQLQAAIEAEIGRYGSKDEERRFHPHLTLGRVRREAGREDLARLSEMLQQQEVGTLGTVNADGVSLMRSELTPDGAQYTRLHFARLGGGA